jgi:hypothetical protein
MIQKRAKFSGMVLGLAAMLTGCASSGAGSGSSPAPTATLTASPTAFTIGPGVGSTLTFTSTNAETGSINNSVGAVGTDSHVVVYPTATTTYTYTATGPGGSATATATVTVSPAPTVTITPSSTLVTAAQSTTLTVTATNATQVVIADNQDATTHTLPAAGGTLVVTPGIPTIYQATASGANGSTAVETVAINVLPTVTLSASPTSIFPGQSVTLTWTSTGDTSLAITNNVNSTVDEIGETVLSGGSSILQQPPTQTTIYTATATQNDDQGTAATATATATVTVSPVNSFEGMVEPASAFTSMQPNDVDPYGAVGTKQFMEYVNTQYQAFDKTTFAPVAQNGVSTPLPIETPWTENSIEQCALSTIEKDAVISFDRLASRWVIAAKSQDSTGSYYFCIAVSNTDDVSLNTLAWYAYAFPLDSILGTNPGGTTYFPDWPKIGTWPDAYYVTIDVFDQPTEADVGVIACALDRTDMLLGNTMLSPQCFTGPSILLSNGLYLGHSLIPADVDGTVAPPLGRDEFMVSIENPINNNSTLTSNTINLWDFHVDWTTPANSTFTLLSPSPAVTTYIPGCYLYVQDFPGITNCVQEPAAMVSGAETGQVIDSVGDRFMPRFSYRNFGTYESFLVSHTVQTGPGASGNASNDYQTGIRWYEFRDDLSGAPAVYQSGTISPDTNLFRFLPSIAQDHMGNAAVGYSVSNGSASILGPGINASYWSLVTPGAQSNEFAILTGTGEEVSANGVGAWGTYSGMTVDPTDDCTFWYVNEYWPTDSSWSTRIANFIIPGCQ